MALRNQHHTTCTCSQRTLTMFVGVVTLGYQPYTACTLVKGMNDYVCGSCDTPLSTPHNMYFSQRTLTMFVGVVTLRYQPHTTHCTSDVDNKVLHIPQT